MRAPPMLCPRNVIVCALVLCAWTASSADAAVVTYTFESPQFVLGQQTPLLNRAPNVGDPDFRADFTSAPAPNGLQVFSNPFFAPFLTGQVLFEPTVFPTADALTVSLNTPVDSVSFRFLINQSPGGAAGSLAFASPVGNLTTPAGNVGVGFQGGTVSFTSPTPFTTFSLQAFGSTGARVEFAIDNLTMNTTTEVIPEPASLTLLAIGAVGLAGAARRRRSAA